MNDTDETDPLMIRMMPRDVTTCWNLPNNMLIFTHKYRQAIDEITGDSDMRKYELDENEWEIVDQLCNLLEVQSAFFF